MTEIDACARRRGNVMLLIVAAAALLMVPGRVGAQALDPRCGNRAAQGAFVCVIDRPAVNARETVYPSVKFAPGDIVDVRADGCVQTGGTGDTWKRYVNPGDNNYHGLIRIPSASPAGDGLVTVQDAIRHRQTVTGAGVPLADLVLHLGYQDDDYTDNGYYRHDDGTEDQCKNDLGHGGPAQVFITIYRGVMPPVPVSRFNFDLLSPFADARAVDPNLLPLNPQWSWQLRAGNAGHVPDPAICHNFSVRNTALGIPQATLSANFPDCTDQTDNTNVDAPSGFNAEICNVGGIFKSDSFSGHINWFPITLEGHAAWGGEEIDDDNSFSFVSDSPGDPLGLTGYPSLHVEFDSDETTKRFGSDEWKDFHQHVVNNDTELAQHYFNGHTIVTGMFGLDGEHNLKSELHPLFALATDRENFGNDATHDDWLIFVRNRGDEGFCSSQLWDAGFEDYTFRLPWRSGMASVDVNWTTTQFEGTDGTSGPAVISIAPPSTDAGVYLTFHLGPAAGAPFIDGSLKLVWVPGPGLSGHALVTSVAARTVVRVGGPPGALAENDVNETENRLRAVELGLTPAQRAAVQVTRSAAVAPQALHALPLSGTVSRLTIRPKFTAFRSRTASRRAGPATAKLQRDTALLQAICAAGQAARAGLPVGFCMRALTTVAKPVLR